jgi:hypothetical protein
MLSRVPADLRLFLNIFLGESHWFSYRLSVATPIGGCGALPMMQLMPRPTSAVASAGTCWLDRYCRLMIIVITRTGVLDGPKKLLIEFMRSHTSIGSDTV